MSHTPVLKILVIDPHDALQLQFRPTRPSLPYLYFTDASQRLFADIDRQADLILPGGHFSHRERQPRQHATFENNIRRSIERFGDAEFESTIGHFFNRHFQHSARPQVRRHFVLHAFQSIQRVPITHRANSNAPVRLVIQSSKVGARGLHLNAARVGIFSAFTQFHPMRKLLHRSIRIEYFGSNAEFFLGTGRDVEVHRVPECHPPFILKRRAEVPLDALHLLEQFIAR